MCAHKRISTDYNEPLSKQNNPLSKRLFWCKPKKKKNKKNTQSIWQLEIENWHCLDDIAALLNTFHSINCRWEVGIYFVLFIRFSPLDWKKIGKFQTDLSATWLIQRHKKNTHVIAQKIQQQNEQTSTTNNSKIVKNNRAKQKKKHHSLIALPFGFSWHLLFI